MTADSPVVFISHSRIRPGQLDGLRSFLTVGVPALEAAKPRTAAFLAYVDEASMMLTIVHLFTNASDFAAHVEGADERSDTAATFIEPVAIEIHGQPDDETIAAIRAGLPNDVPVRIGTEYIDGFLRPSNRHRDSVWGLRE
jgi:hypothetical protein